MVRVVVTMDLVAMVGMGVEVAAMAMALTNLFTIAFIVFRLILKCNRFYIQ
jgi:hypothetical protein